MSDFESTPTDPNKFYRWRSCVQSTPYRPRRTPQDSRTKSFYRDIRNYYHPSMCENPWAELEKKYEKTDTNTLENNKSKTSNNTSNKFNSTSKDHVSLENKGYE